MTKDTVVGKRIRRERERRAWSRERLAAELGVAHRTLVRWEQGEGAPSAVSARRLATVLGGDTEDYIQEVAA